MLVSQEIIPYIVQTTALREMRVLCEDIDDIVTRGNRSLGECVRCL